MHKLYRWFKRWLELRRIDRWYLGAEAQWKAGKFSDEQLRLWKESTIREKEKLG